MHHNSYENFPSSEVYKFKLRGREKDRYITAVRGLPFYCSSGQYSKNPGTWFVCRGISDGNWIRKSKLAYSDFQSFCVQQTICLKHLESRLGSTMEAVCISASLGGGFWDTKNGLLAKNFLLENYSHYFLPDEMIKEILIAKEKTEKEKQIFLSSPKEINSKLIELGVFLPLDNHYNRLPTDKERKYLFNAFTDNNKKIRSALSMMLNTEQKIDKLTFDSVLKLAQLPLLMDYALENHLFENKLEVTAFNELMSNKKDITQDDLKNLHVLKNILFSDYKFFLENHACRKALRIIGKKDGKNSGFGLKCDTLELDLINELHKKNLLNVHVNLLKKTSTRTALTILFENKLIDKSNVKMIKSLDKKKQLKPLLYHPESDAKLKNLCAQHRISREEINKLSYGVDKGKKLAPPPPKSLNKKSFVKYSVFNEIVTKEDPKKNEKTVNSAKDPSSSLSKHSESVQMTIPTLRF